MATLQLSNYLSVIPAAQMRPRSASRRLPIPWPTNNRRPHSTLNLWIGPLTACSGRISRHLTMSFPLRRSLSPWSIWAFVICWNRTEIIPHSSV